MSIPEGPVKTCKSTWLRMKTEIKEEMRKSGDICKMLKLR
jgi:hypothetical protein